MSEGNGRRRIFLVNKLWLAKQKINTDFTNEPNNWICHHSAKFRLYCRKTIILFIELQFISNGKTIAIVNVVHHVEVLAESRTKSRQWLPEVALLPHELTPTNSCICRVKLFKTERSGFSILCRSSCTSWSLEKVCKCIHNHTRYRAC